MTREEILGMEAGFALDTLVELHVFNHTKSMYLQAGPYSTDIKAAWEVWNKMLENFPEKESPALEFILALLDGDICTTYRDLVYLFKKVTPEAICKAALLAVMEEKTEV
jgi:hypothetical protein